MKNIPHLGFTAVLLCFICSANAIAACNLNNLMGFSYQGVQAVLELDETNAGVTDGSIYVSGSQACRGSGTLSGAVIEIQFLDHQVVQIEVKERHKISQRKRVLATWVESNYGVKSDKPVSYFGKKPNAQWHWEVSGAVITYSIVTTELEIIEYVQIQSTVHEELFARYGAELDKP